VEPMAGFLIEFPEGFRKGLRIACDLAIPPF